MISMTWFNNQTTYQPSFSIRICFDVSTGMCIIYTMCETYRYAVMRYTPQRQPLHHRIQPILQTNLKTNCQLLEDLDLSFKDLPAAVHGPPVFNSESSDNCGNSILLVSLVPRYNWAQIPGYTMSCKLLTYANCNYKFENKFRNSDLHVCWEYPGIIGHRYPGMVCANYITHVKHKLRNPGLHVC